VTPEGVLIFCRFLFDGAAISLWGASAYLGALVPQVLRRDVDLRLRSFNAIAVGTVVVVTAAMLPLRTATISEGWADALAPQMLRAVLLETDVGMAWFVQACGALLLAAATALPQAYRRKAQALCAGLLLFSLTISGHAAMNNGWLRIVHRVNDGVHLLAGGAWLGALLPVLLILPKLHKAQLQADARRALMRFSTAGHVAVALVLVSGIINTLLIVGSLPTDWSFAYQRLLSIKILLVGAMVAIAIVNRYIFVPRLGRDPSLRALQGCVVAEVGLGLAVIGLVALFGTLQPV
jgi:putative copper resistance protein D